MSAIDQHANDLFEALRNGRAIAPLRDSINNDIPTAYAIQDKVVALRLAEGEHIVGKKIGLTSPAVQAQLGVDQPDYGVLFETMDMTGKGPVPMELLMQPKVEGELAFVLGEDLIDPEMDMQRLKLAIVAVKPAIEIVGSRIENWNITISDTIADNASGSHYILSTQSKPLAEVATASIGMVMLKNGKVASEGSGEACMGDPLNAALWLAQTMARMGRPLLKGEVLLSGALGPMVSVERGDAFELRIDGFSSTMVSFK
ncbi:fumarylacetoacetate hydrolase family protein [Schleiferiaceae bacterium]|nr:fumarylacetoacetate hydrolase family protein [Schleiferiaceae bacterium]